MSDTPTEPRVRKAIRECCEEPKERNEVYAELSFPESLIRVVMREMLYEGELQTTPEWQFVIAE